MNDRYLFESKIESRIKTLLLNKRCNKCFSEFSKDASYHSSGEISDLLKSKKKKFIINKRNDNPLPIESIEKRLHKGIYRNIIKQSVLRTNPSTLCIFLNCSKCDNYIIFEVDLH